jgi:protein-S-isoprenylcysteine O-methyltransferase Ste14
MLRHLLSILLLPFVVVVIVPYLLLTTFANIDTRWGNASLSALLPRAVGTISMIGGLTLFGWCVSLFMRVGKGTLAPWDPTRNLVAKGPYRFVRNPMIWGVALMVLGEALIWGSWMMGVWACVFFLINHIYFVLSEEPGLERRFGDHYRAYKADVPRWIPWLRPWSGKQRNRVRS